MKLHEMKNVVGAVHRKKRVGCGEGMATERLPGAVEKVKVRARAAVSVLVSRVDRCLFTENCPIAASIKQPSGSSP